MVSTNMGSKRDQYHALCARVTVPNNCYCLDRTQTLHTPSMDGESESCDSDVIWSSLQESHSCFCELLNMLDTHKGHLENSASKFSVFTLQLNRFIQRVHQCACLCSCTKACLYNRDRTRAGTQEVQGKHLMFVFVLYSVESIIPYKVLFKLR